MRESFNEDNHVQPIQDGQAGAHEMTTLQAAANTPEDWLRLKLSIPHRNLQIVDHLEVAFRISTILFSY